MITVAEVTRAGLRATKAEVEVTVADQPHRTWADIRTMIDNAELAEPVRRSAQAVFARLATAEGRVHGIPAEAVSFHEVGALDSIADVVGVCAALVDLNVTSLSAGAVGPWVGPRPRRARRPAGAGACGRRAGPGLAGARRRRG